MKNIFQPSVVWCINIHHCWSFQFDLHTLSMLTNATVAGILKLHSWCYPPQNCIFNSIETLERTDKSSRKMLNRISVKLNRKWSTSFWLWEANVHCEEYFNSFWMPIHRIECWRVYVHLQSSRSNMSTCTVKSEWIYKRSQNRRNSSQTEYLSQSCVNVLAIAGQNERNTIHYVRNMNQYESNTGEKNTSHR